ncbi:MAG: protoporphyrinogen/coproporphyrinogen oxidase, partial [Gemmatimonadales bacterium]
MTGPRVVVVGAGIAGLAAAWELARAGVPTTVVDSERRAGGMILTERRDGFVVEGGPDSWLAREPEIPALATELGVADRIVEQTARGSWLWTGNALRPIEEGRAAALLGIQADAEDLGGGFASFAAGMGELIDALRQRLGDTLHTPLGVSGLTPDGAGWRLAVSGGAMIAADAVVLALPAYAAGRLLEHVGASGARALADVPYLPSVTVSLAYEATQVGAALEGTGFVAAPGQGGTVRACTYASQKFPGRAPRGRLLLRAFLGSDWGDEG